MDWIAVWDLETTLPEDGSFDCDIVEFGVLLVDPARLTIQQEYSSLVQSDRVSAASQAVNGIGPDSLRQAPRFPDLAQRIHQLLDGQVWAGHNLEQFDIPILNRAFQQFNADPPRALKVLDTYRLFGDWLRRRAGDAKLATACRHFGLQAPSHRALDDCRAVWEVLLRCTQSRWLERQLGTRLTRNAKTVRLRTAVQQALREGRPLRIRYRGGTRPLGTPKDHSFAMGPRTQDPPRSSLPPMRRRPNLLALQDRLHRNIAAK